MLKKLFNRIPYFEALRAFLEQWGLWAYIKAAAAIMIGLIYGAWGWLESNLPYWAITLLIISVWALFLFTVNYSVEVYRKISAERLDHNVIADDLIKLSDEMLRAINDFRRERLLQTGGDGATDINNIESIMAQQFKSRASGDALVRHISQNYGRRVVASVLLLKKLEVALPFHLSHVSDSTIVGIASFFGAVGQLIKDGNLSVAQEMDAQTNWEVSGLLR